MLIFTRLFDIELRRKKRPSSHAVVAADVRRRTILTVHSSCPPRGGARVLASQKPANPLASLTRTIKKSPLRSLFVCFVCFVCFVVKNSRSQSGFVRFRPVSSGLARKKLFWRCSPKFVDYPPFSEIFRHIFLPNSITPLAVSSCSIELFRIHAGQNHRSFGQFRLFATQPLTLGCNPPRL